jgi:hypothetical protein
MRSTWILALSISALSAGVLSVAGCDGGGDGEGGNGGGGPTAEAACESLTSALCGQLDTCAPFLLQLSYGDKSTCIQRITPACLITVDLSGSTITPAAIQTCADTYENASCDQIYKGQPKECQLAGEKADGEACESAVQCKGFVCNVTADGECGTCDTLLTEGATCDPQKDLCSDGLYCGPASSKCETFAAKDQPCTEQKRCESGLSCNAGKCGALQPVGADCSNGETCDIAVGAYCGTGGTCKTLLVAKLGEQCGLVGDDLVGCEPDTLCAVADNTCVARPKEGEACAVDDNGNGNCMTGFRCVNGKCSSAALECN